MTKGDFCADDLQPNATLLNLKSVRIDLLFISNELEIRELFETLSLSSKLKNTVMSTLERLVEKGRIEEIEEGIEKGEERKSYVVVKNLLLTNKFTIAEIAYFANVTEAFVQKVMESLQ